MQVGAHFVTFFDQNVVYYLVNLCGMLRSCCVGSKTVETGVVYWHQQGIHVESEGKSFRSDTMRRYLLGVDIVSLSQQK